MSMEKARQVVLSASPLAQRALDPLAGLLPARTRFGGSAFEKWRQIAILATRETSEADGIRAKLLQDVLTTAIDRAPFYADRPGLAAPTSPAKVWELSLIHI